MSIIDDLFTQLASMESGGNITPDSVKTSKRFMSAIGRATVKARRKDAPPLPASNFNGIPIVIDPKVPDDEFWWIYEGRVIGKIVLVASGEAKEVSRDPQHSSRPESFADWAEYTEPRFGQRDPTFWRDAEGVGHWK